MDRNKNSLVLLAVLLILASLAYLPFVYQDTLGEPDSFRMANGFIYSIRNDTPFEGPLLFRLDASFGFYALLYLFTPIFKTNLALVIPFMNYINATSAILMVIPFFFVIKRYWGTVTAVSANVLLFFVPVWWNASLYGHPMLPAIFFMFVGLALIGSRSQVAAGQGMFWKLVGLDGLIVIAFFLCLAFRFDALLWLFPLIPCCLWLERYSFKRLVLYSTLYGVLSVMIFLAAQSLVVGGTPQTVAGGIGGQILERVLTLNHALAISLPVLGRGILTGSLAYHPLYLLAFGISCFYLAYQHRYRTLLFILPVFILNFIFWIPNPSPARHFIFPTPLLAIGVAIGLSTIPQWVKYRVAKDRLSSLIPRTLLFVLASLIASELLYLAMRTYYPWQNERPEYFARVPIRSIFINSFYIEKHFQDAAHFAQALQQLEPKDKPILVIADASPVLLELQLLSQDVRELQSIEKTINQSSWRLYLLRNERNYFIMPLVKSEKRNELAKLFKEFDDVYLTIDPTFYVYDNDIIPKENTILLDP
jgi:hypothetical protein